MTAREINPTQASADLDALTLSEWSIVNSHIHLVLTGGLGRITTPDGRMLAVDELGAVTLERQLEPLEASEVAAISEILARWNTIGTPLRLLEFSDDILVVEDESNYLQLPAGPTLGSSEQQ